MTPRQPGPFWILASFLAALFACAMAQADDGAFVTPNAEDLIVRWGVSALIIGIGVRILRRFLRPWLAPSPATHLSRSLTLLACLLLGLGLGLIGTAPPVAVGLAGKVVGGVSAGGFAYFFAKVVGPRLRGEGKGAKDGDRDEPEATFPPEGP